MTRRISHPRETRAGKGRDTSVEKVQVRHSHKKRWRPVSLGRNPWMAVANDYLKAMKGVLAESTWTEMERRLRRMDKDFRTLEEKGLIEGYNPNKIGDKEIVAFIGMLRARGVHDSGMSHEVSALSNVLRFVGSGALERCMMKYPQMFPKRTFVRYEPLEDEERSKIVDAAALVSDDDWRRMEAYGMSVLAICSGLRPKEFRLSHVSDLDLKRGTMHAEEVKGKGRYGEPRDVAIHPDGYPFLKRYLRSRSLAIAAYPLCDVLFPALNSLKKGKDGVMSSNGIGDLRREFVCTEVGIKFDYRKCRRTYGQTGVDDNIPVDAMSRMMGHASTKTTERYYCRKSTKMAIEEAQRVWGSQPTPSVPQTSPEVNSPKPPSIKSQEWLPGYN